MYVKTPKSITLRVYILLFGFPSPLVKQSSKKVFILQTVFSALNGRLSLAIKRDIRAKAFFQQPIP